MQCCLQFLVALHLRVLVADLPVEISPGRVEHGHGGRNLLGPVCRQSIQRPHSPATSLTLLPPSSNSCACRGTSAVRTPGPRRAGGESSVERIESRYRVAPGGLTGGFRSGQPDLDSNNSGAGRHELNWPISVATDGERIVVADTYNDHLLIWDSFPAENGRRADLEIRVD